jgi:hypothetical protein
MDISTIYHNTDSTRLDTVSDISFIQLFEEAVAEDVEVEEDDKKF